MADSGSEDEKLRKQIAFLTQLINSAKSSTGTRNTNKGSTTPITNAAATGPPQLLSRPGQPRSGFHGGKSSSLHNSQSNSSTVLSAGKTLSKYSWSKTKPAEANAQRQENVTIKDTSVLQNKITASYGTKYFENDSRSMSAFDRTLGVNKSIFCDDVKSVVCNDIKYSQTSSAIAQALPSVSHSGNKPSKRSSDICYQKPENLSHQSRTQSVSSGNSHIAIQQRILATQKAIEDLKKGLEERTQRTVSNPSHSPDKKGHLQSLSPHKLQTVPSCTASITSTAKSVQGQQTSAPQHEPLFKNSYTIKSSMSVNIATKASTGVSASHIMKSKYSLKRVSSAPSLASSYPTNSWHKKPTPSKLVLKTRYALKRERPSTAVKINYGKNVSTHIFSPKFVNVSRYSLKRIRRSLSDEAKSKKQPSGCDSSVVGKSTAQYAAHVIRTKYKVQKVFKGQQSVWSSGYKGYQTTYKPTVPGWRSRHTVYQSRREQHTTGATSFYSYIPKHKLRFNQSRWAASKAKRYEVYTGFKHSYAPFRYQQSRYSRWQQPGAGFISRKYVKRKLAWLKQNIPFNPKMKVDRRTTSPQKAGAVGTPQVNMVMVNGMLYKSSGGAPAKTHQPSRRPSLGRGATWSGIRHASANSMKTISVRGVMFSMGNDGKKLTRLNSETPAVRASQSKRKVSTEETPVTRVDFGGVTYVQTKPGTLERLGSAQTRKMAMRVVNRSVARVAARPNKLVKRQFCMFYNRFGKCNKASSCPYLHDPDKIAVCTRFLRGTCKAKGCPFSHKVSREKMPVCSFFLKGVCSKDDCPYRHVNVSRDAEVCAEFVKGYCSQGEKCKKKHILVCAEFARTGKCKDGKHCRLQHKKRAIRSTDKQDNSSEKQGKLSPTILDKETPLLRSPDEQLTPQDDPNLPFKERKLPAYISLNLKKDMKLAASPSNPSSVICVASGSKSIDKVIQIRPQL